MYRGKSSKPTAVRNAVEWRVEPTAVVKNASTDGRRNKGRKRSDKTTVFMVRY